MPTHEETNKRALAAYLNWRMLHTLENRTPKEMWLAGYFYAKDESALQVIKGGGETMARPDDPRPSG